MNKFEIRKQPVKYGVFGLAGLLFIGLLAYAFVINPVLIRQERARFEKTKDELTSFENKVIDLIGQPTEVKRDESCGRAHLKTSSGPLLCDISTTLSYEGISTDQANRMLADVSSISRKSLRKGSGGTRGTSFINIQPASIDQVFFQDYLVANGLDCNVDYSYMLDKQVFEVGLSCSGRARSEYYSVTD